EDRQLLDVLLERKDLVALMPEADIRAAMDPANYTGGAKEIVDRMVAEVERELKVQV
ncbi:MAG: adenylosuccinate lyase, partial [Candidatus Methanomethylophilaceae archaeon]|nr:adenylosuccinate lyase [Candidatus Methanomethylophilaceae archaeon]